MFKMFEVIIPIVVVVVIYFHFVCINMFLNFIYFIIKNYLYLFNYAYKLFKTKLMNLVYLKLIFFLLLL